MPAPLVIAGARVVAGGSGATARGGKSAAPKFTKATPRRSPPDYKAGSVRRAESTSFSRGRIAFRSARQGKQVASETLKNSSKESRVGSARGFKIAFMAIRIFIIPTAFIQIFFGFLTLVALGFWAAARSWTWGLSDYIVSGEKISLVVWGLSVFINLATLGFVVLILLLVARLPLFSTFRTYWAFIIAFIIAVNPYTGFISAAAIFSIVVYFTFRKKLAG